MFIVALVLLIFTDVVFLKSAICLEENSKVPYKVSNLVSNVLGLDINVELKAEGAKKYFFMKNNFASGVYFFHCSEYNQTIRSSHPRWEQFKSPISKKTIPSATEMMEKILEKGKKNSVPAHILNVIKKIRDIPNKVNKEQKDFISSEAFERELKRRMSADMVSDNLLIQPLLPLYFEIYRIGEVEHLGPVYIALEFYQESAGTLRDLKTLRIEDILVFLYSMFKDQYTLILKNGFYHSDIHGGNVVHFETDTHLFLIDESTKDANGENSNSVVVKKSIVFKYIDFGDTDSLSISENVDSKPFLKQYEVAIGRLLNDLLKLSEVNGYQTYIEFIINFEEKKRETIKSNFKNNFSNQNKNEYLKDYFESVARFIFEQVKLFENKETVDYSVIAKLSEIPPFFQVFYSEFSGLKDSVNKLKIESEMHKTLVKKKDAKLDEKDAKLDEKDDWIKKKMQNWMKKRNGG